jgi:hypothetical protein
MECPVCGLYRGMAQYTVAQAKSIRTGRGCSSGGREVCKDCWSSGPTESDIIDLDDYLAFWRLDVDTHRSDVVEFMIEFVQYVRSGDNRLKLRSHWGAIRSWQSDDPREGFGWTRRPASPTDVIAGGLGFDPTNRVRTYHERNLSKSPRPSRMDE